MKQLFILLTLVFWGINSHGQILLEADGKTDSFALISNAFAPNYEPFETPGSKKDTCDNHSSFNQKHITQVYDSILKKHVFKFVIHVKEDNDRCVNFDRQRNEIKGYKRSPETMKGTLGETVIYTWKFKLSKDFTPSKKFTHLHQIKSVGEEPRCKPIFTLSAKKGKTNDVFRVRHSTGKTAETLTQVDLNLLRGNWVTVKEVITYNISKKGSYSINVINSITKETILNYQNPSIETWNTGAEFVRPKWGIYRSLLNASHLKDEELFFADFKITEQ